MSRPCSICESPDRAQVEIGLANGISQRVLGLKFCLDQTQLSRHRSRHMHADAIANMRVRGSRSDEELDLLDRLVRQLGSPIRAPREGAAAEASIAQPIEHLPLLSKAA